MSRPPLADLQRAVASYMISGTVAPSLARIVRSARGVSAVQRLDIYRNAYYTRLQEALAHDFPVLLAVAGDQAFGELATGYLLEHPSERPSVRWLGRHLPTWLRRRRAGEPLLGDIAALEWTVLHAFDAEDAPVARAARLASIGPERWAAMRVTFHPSVSFVTATTNARVMWSAVRSETTMPAPGLVDERLVVWRTGRSPAVVAIDAASWQFFSALRTTTVADACETLAATGLRAVPDIAARSLIDALGHGWICELDG